MASTTWTISSELIAQVVDAIKKEERDVRCFALNRVLHGMNPCGVLESVCSICISNYPLQM